MVLNGARILVTRPEHQAENLSRLIEEQGGVAVRFPTLEIVAKDVTNDIKNTLTNLNQYQWIIFISVNAVNFALQANNGKIAEFISATCRLTVKFAAVGQATAQAMKRAGLPVDLMPTDDFSSEALLAMPELHQLEGRHCLIIRGEGGREQLADTLQSRGAKVTYLEVYKRIMPRIDSSLIDSMLQQHCLDVITVTSVEALQNLNLILGNKIKQLSLIPLVVISDRIRHIAADLGFNRIAVTDKPSDAAILETVITCVTGE